MDKCSQESVGILFICLCLFFGGFFIVRASQSVWNYFRDKSNGTGFFAGLKGGSPVIRIFAIHKMEEKKVRLHLEIERPNGEIQGCNVDLEPTAAVELAQSIKVSANLVANLEVVQ